MDDNSNKPAKRRNKFAGKENISRETAENILSAQIDRLREISRTNDETANQVRESVNNNKRCFRLFFGAVFVCFFPFPQLK